MLLELAVTDLGVIERVQIVFAAGMTALTGETGAGKTMVVEAIELLAGGRADSDLVRPGADEATVEGRFLDGDDEVVLTRVVPATGRSRAYVNGKLAPVSALAEWAAKLVDLHGQHAHQSLLSTSVQRAALDRYGAVDIAPLLAAKAELTDLDAALAELGGDERARARELDLVRFQVDELDRARIEGADEDERLAAVEDVLADAVAHQAGAVTAVELLTGEGSAADAIGTAVASIAGRGPFAAAEERLRAVSAELTDIAADLRGAAEGIEPDPERLEAIRQRRNTLHELCRKYGDTLPDVIAFAETARERLDALEAHDARAAAIDEQRNAAVQRLTRAEAKTKAARAKVAPALAAATQSVLGELAMASAKVEVTVEGDAGEQVAFLLAANPGAPMLPLAKVASGGELARAMLALRLVTGDVGDDGPTTLVFDEVDAGIGGAAAVAVGRALADVAKSKQVLVVTHLAQVAASAHTQVGVTKRDDGDRTTATVRVLDADDRVEELARMLSGSPRSETARRHAAELLGTAIPG